jgi:hypothetical protein
MASTASAAGATTAALHSSAVLPSAGVPISPDGDTLSSTAGGTPSSMAPSSGITVGAPMSQALHNVSIKALVPYTLDMEMYNYTKWRTLFSMVLCRFNMLHHVTDDAIHPTDLEWTKDDLLIGN